MVTRKFDAEINKLSDVLEFIDNQLEENDCPMKNQMQIDVAAEEIFVNVAHYAYTPDIGIVEICVEIAEDPRRVSITFTDSGKPFDPLKKPDPDTTLSLEERPIGGLGIYMVKKSMDEVRYEFVNGQNRLTIIKEF